DRRVSTDARPLNRLVMVAMAAPLLAIAFELARADGPPVARWLSLPLALVPIGIAAIRTVPAAVRLGAQEDPLVAQGAATRAICAQHLFCACCIAALLLVQLLWMA